MKESEIKQLASHGIFQDKPVHGKVEETHISWVILTKYHAFKIKKPLKLSFLDFSSIQRRKHFCRREVSLNSRFTHIYQGVISIRVLNGKWCMDCEEGKLIDYAVQMKRLRLARRMNNLLRRRKVNEKNVESLAGVIASFHEKAKVINLPFSLVQAKNTFNDVNLIRKFVLEYLGVSFAKIIDRSIQWSNKFLKTHAKRFQQRIDLGFKRDVHGDLHSGNIFLYRRPILFDCIEFNDQYRQIDVLYELAFLCMDLEGFRQKHLAKIFLSSYTQKFQCFEGVEDYNIFRYFKCLRANVRAKVHAMGGAQTHDQQKIKQHARETAKYLTLMETYMESNLQLPSTQILEKNF